MKGGEGPALVAAHVVDVGLVTGPAELDFLRVFKRGKITDAKEQQRQNAQGQQMQPQRVPLGLPTPEDDKRYNDTTKDRDRDPDGEEDPPIQPTPPLQRFTVHHIYLT
jgi:hypothetical protein